MTPTPDTWKSVRGSVGCVLPSFYQLSLTQHTWKMWDFFFFLSLLQHHSSLTWMSAKGL